MTSMDRGAQESCEISTPLASVFLSCIDWKHQMQFLGEVAQNDNLERGKVVRWVRSEPSRADCFQERSGSMGVTPNQLLGDQSHLQNKISRWYRSRTIPGQPTAVCQQ